LQEVRKLRSELAKTKEVRTGEKWTTFVAFTLLIYGTPHVRRFGTSYYELKQPIQRGSLLSWQECRQAQDECRRLEVIIVGTESATPQKPPYPAPPAPIIPTTPTGEPSTPQNLAEQSGMQRPTPGSTSSMASEKSTEEVRRDRNVLTRFAFAF
jgi:hypothetical protein